jgi:hypothetical protein
VRRVDLGLLGVFGFGELGGEVTRCVLSGWWLGCAAEQLDVKRLG